jgi:hypothetical protein
MAFSDMSKKYAFFVVVKLSAKMATIKGFNVISVMLAADNF